MTSPNYKGIHSHKSDEREPFLLVSHTNQLEVPEEDDEIITNSKIMTSKFFQLKESHHVQPEPEPVVESPKVSATLEREDSAPIVRESFGQQSVILIPGFEIAKKVAPTVPESEAQP